MTQEKYLNKISLVVILFGLLSSLILGVIFYTRYSVINIWLYEKASALIILTLGLILFQRKYKISHFILLYFGIYFFARVILLLQAVHIGTSLILITTSLYTLVFLIYLAAILQPKARNHININFKNALIQFSALIFIVIGISGTSYWMAMKDNTLIELPISNTDYEDLIIQELDKDYENYSFDYAVTIDTNSSINVSQDSIINLKIKIQSPNFEEITEVWLVSKKPEEVKILSRLKL